MRCWLLNFAPRAYAESLVSLAEKSFLRRGVQLAQAAVSQVQQLRMRLAEILRKDRVAEGSVGGKKPGLALLSLAFLVAGYGALSAPRLVAFSDSPDARAAVASAGTMLPSPTPSLQPVNLRYPIVAAPVREVVKGSTRVAHRNTEAKPRSALVQRAAVSRYADAEPNSQTVLVSPSRGSRRSTRPCGIGGRAVWHQWADSLAVDGRSPYPGATAHSQRRNSKTDLAKVFVLSPSTAFNN